MQEAETPDVPEGTSKKKGERTRQSMSCAECRRLKLKCSREWPCTSCQKRGCAQICPDGEMRTVRGRRLVIGDTEDLHQRILNLETALAESHAHQSSEPHPLLTKTYHQTRPRRFHTSLDLDDGDQVVEQAFGTLTIGLGGEARFVGSLAGSEYLHDEEEPSPEGMSSPGVDPDMSGLATPPLTAGFAAGTGDTAQLELIGLATGSSDNVQRLQELLPNWNDEGRAAIEAYWENVNWMYQIIPRPMFDNDHLVNAYDDNVAPQPHKLACVFLVMALGVLFDLNRQPYEPRSKELYNLGVKCIQAGGFRKPSLALAQALHLCGTFLLNDNDAAGAETFWPMLGSAIKIAQRLGLHRDGETFGLSPYEVKERRQIWWELVTHDRLQSLCFGRPCSASNKSSDTQYPTADELIADKDQFHKQKYNLVRMIEQVIDLQTQPGPVSIQRVLNIDQEFQNFKDALPDDLLPNIPIESLPLDNTIHPHLILHRFGIRLLVAQTRLLLNRPAFARALRDQPEDPAMGSLGHAFVALYESALEIVQLVKALVVYHPSLIARWWFYWRHAASASVCLSAIVIQAPNCAFASPAFHAMTLVVDICKASKDNSRAKRMLPTLLRLQARASEALRTTVESGRQVKGEVPSGSNDDLDHLRNSAKLRRTGAAHQPPDTEFNQYVHNSASPTPRPTDVNPNLLVQSPLVMEEASPISMGSIATSDTMVEVIINEYGGQIWSMPLRGAVPPPPPDVSTSSPREASTSAQRSEGRPRHSLKRPRRSTVQATRQDEAGTADPSTSPPWIVPVDSGTSQSNNSDWQPALLSRPVPAFRPPTWVVSSPPPRPPVPTHSRTFSYPPMPIPLAPVHEADEPMAGASSTQDLSGDAHAAYQYILSQVGQDTYFAMPSHGDPSLPRTLVPPQTIVTGDATLSGPTQSTLVMTGQVRGHLHSPDKLEEEEDFDFDMFVHHMPDGYTVLKE